MCGGRGEWVVVSSKAIENMADTTFVSVPLLTATISEVLRTIWYSGQLTQPLCRTIMSSSITKMNSVE